MEKKNQEPEVEKQNLMNQLSHRSQRCDLYKRELAIERKNQYSYLEKYRNDLFEKVCAKYKIPRSAFPDLKNPVQEAIPSLNIRDSDFEDDFSEEEFDVDSEDDEVEDQNEKGEPSKSSSKG